MAPVKRYDPSRRPHLHRRRSVEEARMSDHSRDWHTGDYPELRDQPPWVMEEMILAQPSLVQPILGAPGASVATLRAATAAAGLAGRGDRGAESCDACPGRAENRLDEARLGEDHLLHHPRRLIAQLGIVPSVPVAAVVAHSGLLDGSTAVQMGSPRRIIPLDWCHDL